MSNVINEANWKFHWRLTESAGIMIYLADFKGRRVLWEGSLPYVTVDHQRDAVDVTEDAAEPHGPWWVPLGTRTLQGPVGQDGTALSSATDVALTLKHFPGGGPQELGLDPHYAFGKTQVYPGNGFGYHLKPFEAAIDAGVAAIMPYYGVPMNVTYDGVTFDQTGMAFSCSRATATAMCSLPAILLLVGSKPCQPAPGI